MCRYEKLPVLISIILSLNLSVVTFGQTFQRAIPNGTYYSVHELGATRNLLAAGAPVGSGNDMRLLLQKVSSNGDLLSSKTITAATGIGFDNTHPPHMLTPDGDSLAVALYSASIPGNTSIYPGLAKIDTSGNPGWWKAYRNVLATTTNPRGGNSQTIKTSDGNYVSAGWFNPGTGAPFDYYPMILKTDAQGNEIWKVNMAYLTFEFMFAAAEAANGDYAVAGGTYFARLITVNTSGTLQWARTFNIGGNNSSEATGLLGLSDGSFLLSGSVSIAGSGKQGYLLKVNSTGGITWAKTYGGSGDDYFYKVKPTSDGGFIVCGKTKSYGSGLNDGWLTKVDASGNLSWSKVYGINTDDVFNDVIQLTSGGYVAVGAVGTSAWMVKTDATGNSGCHQSAVTPIVTTVTSTSTANNLNLTLNSYSGISSLSTTQSTYSAQFNLYTHIYDTICGSTYNFNGQILTSSGTYFDTLVGRVACDSIIELSLTLYNPATTPKVWNGTVNNNWGEANNWGPCSGVPTAINNVEIPNTSNLPVINTSTAECNSININLGATINIPTGNSLTVNGTLTNNGHVYIQDGGSLVQTTGSTLAGTGHYHVSRVGTATQAEYNYWSSPITTGNTSTLGSGTFEYNPANGTADTGDDNPADPGWQVYAGGMAVAKGYAQDGAGSVTFHGRVNNGPLSIAVSSYTNPNPSLGGVPYNLIGNPYPSTLSGNAFLTANSSRLNGALYFWDDDLSGGTTYASNDYAVWNGVGGTAGGGGHTPDGNIAVAQGFKVFATSSGNVNFTNAMRVGNNTHFFSQSNNTKLWLSVTTGNNHHAQTLIGFMEDGSDDTDWFYDAKKVNGNPFLSFSSLLDGEEMAIQGYGPLVSDKIIPLALASGEATEISFELDSTYNLEQGAQVILEDAYLNVFHDLSESSYTLSITESDYVDRFFLHVGMAETTSISDLDEDEARIYYHNGKVYLNATGMEGTALLNINNSMGQLIQTRTINAQGQSLLSVNVPNLPAGTYIVSVVMNNKVLAGKILIMN